MADGYATAFMLMPLEDVQIFAAKHPDLYIMILYADTANQLQQFTTPNFQKLQLK